MRDAAVQNVAADRDRAAFERSEMLSQRQRVEQGLGRMLVCAVAGIDHRAIDQRRHFFRRAVLAVAEDERVGLHRAQAFARCRRGFRLS